MTRRIATALALLVSVTGMTACGNKQDTSNRAETEGEYVDVGPLKYQVQISRQLNPVDIEDKDYLAGLAPADQPLAADQVWFAVFVKVEYDSKEGKPYPTATDFELRDTQEHRYSPTPVENTFAYRPLTLTPRAFNPPVDSTASEGTTSGALLLFKLPLATLSNRPLELVISSPVGNGTAAIDLDV